MPRRDGRQGENTQDSFATVLLREPARTFLGAAGVATVGALAATVASYWPKPFIRLPNPAEFAEQFWGEDTDYVRYELAVTLVAAYNRNSVTLTCMDWRGAIALAGAVEAGLFALLGIGNLLLGLRYGL